MSNGSAEITLIAKYTNYVYKAEDILRETAAGRWSPSETEFIDVARQGGVARENISAVGDIMAFLSAMQTRQSGGLRGKPRPAGSLKRVNLFAHGTKTAISLHGSVLQPKPGASSPEVTIAGGNGVIDVFSLDAMERQSEEQVEASRKIFSQGGGIYIYACESGMNGDILERIADFFKVKVHGFIDLIEYCPRKTLEKGAKSMQRGSSRLFYKIGETHCSTYDFHQLIPTLSK